MEVHHSKGDPSWKVLFTNKDLFARMWRVALLQFMAQMCGSTAMKYYLPTNFIALGLGKELSLLASGIESSLKVGCTIMEMLLIDRLGRRKTLVLGSSIMTIALLVSRSSFHVDGCLRVNSVDQWCITTSIPAQQKQSIRLCLYCIHFLFHLWLLCRLWS